MTFGPNAALVTIAVTIAAGILAQVVGDRWRLPAVVPLLLFGMALGPSGLGLVQPAALGGGLSWNTSQLLTTGTISVAGAIASVPEPAAATLALLGGGALALRVRRRR